MPKRIKRWYYDQLAAWCVLFRRRDLALEYYAKMLELDPGDPLALASLAFQTAQQGRKREALAVFDRLLTVTPDDAEAHFNRGFLLQEMNREINTIGSKADGIGVSELIVSAKAELEKLREQVQNVG